MDPDRSDAKNPEAGEAFFSMRWCRPPPPRAAGEAKDIQAIIDSQSGADSQTGGDSQRAAQHGGFTVAPWDWEFYSEQVRKAKYDLNQSKSSRISSSTTCSRWRLLRRA